MDVIVKIVFRIMDEFKDCRRIRSDDVCDAVSDGKSHHRIVSRCIVLDVINFRRGHKSLADESRQFLCRDTGHGAEDCPVLGIPFDNLRHRDDKSAAEELRPKPGEIVKPHMRHL